MLEVVYYIQPAWSSHPLAIHDSEFAWVGYRSAQEAPLSLLPAETLAQRGLLAPPARWLRNHSPEQSFILTAMGESDLGISAQAQSEIAFTLPVGAETLTLVGLDRSAGAGGCVQCRIVADEPGGKLLWKSGFLTGADPLQDTAPASCGAEAGDFGGRLCPRWPTRGGRSAGYSGRSLFCTPAGDAGGGVAGRATALASVLPGLADWQISASGLALASEWNEADNRWNPRLTIPREAPLRLVRRVRVDHTGDVLELRAACPFALAEHQFMLRVNGTVVDWSSNEDRSHLWKCERNIICPN